MDAALLALSHRQHGVFSATQAVAAGYSTEEIQVLLRRGRWRKVRRGIYADIAVFDAIAGDPRDLHLLQCAAVVVTLHRPLVLSHWSAARFHGLQTLGRPPEDVFGIDPDEARRGRGYAVSGAGLPAEHVVRSDGWCVTTGARTVVDVARTTSFKNGVVIADSALRLGVTSTEALHAVALDLSHSQGIGRAARACSFADGRAESVLESASRVDLVALGLPVPELQVEIHDDGGFIGWVDMLWEELGVAGEADGKVKYLQPYDDRPAGDVLWAEKRRMDRLQNAGLQVVRWTSQELRASPERIVERVRAAGERRPPTPSYRVVSHDCRTSRGP